MTPTTARVLTATEASQLSELAATSLFEQGARPSDRVAIVTPEHRFGLGEAADLQALTVGIVLGCLRAGMVPVMVNPSLTEYERRLILADARPVVTIATAGEFRRAVTPRMPGSTPALLPGPLGRPMHYTSGTTGSPKGVWTHDLSPAESQLLWAEEQELWEFGPTDRYLVQGPLCHSAPLRFALSTVLAGGEVILPGWFTAAGIAAAIAEHRPTVTFAVPTHLQRLLDLPDVPASSFRLLAHAGAACPRELRRRIHEWAGEDRVWEFYGSTEGQFTVCSGPESVAHPGTVGRARPHRQLRIHEGVIWCTAPHYARFRYWGDQRKTESAVRIGPTGIEFTVGDLGRIDDDGYLYLEGRREDLIITGGVNVYPAEVEDILGDLPGLEEIVVFGVDDPQWGQRVEAVYVGTAAPDEVDRAARERLAGHKRPKRLHRVTELPRTTSGKIQRNLLAGLVEEPGAGDSGPAEDVGRS